MGIETRNKYAVPFSKLVGLWSSLQKHVEGKPGLAGSLTHDYHQTLSLLTCHDGNRGWVSVSRLLCYLHREERRGRSWTGQYWRVPSRGVAPPPGVPAALPRTAQTPLRASGRSQTRADRQRSPLQTARETGTLVKGLLCRERHMMDPTIMNKKMLYDIFDVNNLKPV